MSERQTQDVKINLIDVIDHEAPLVDEIRRINIFLGVANKALEVYGIRLKGEVKFATEDIEQSQEKPNVK